MLWLATAAVQAELLPFSEVQKKEEDLVALFFDSSSDNKANLAVYDSLERQFSTSAKFFLVDKQNSQNDDVFKNADFETLPRVFVLIPEEKMAEPYQGPFEESKLKEFINMKLTKPDLSKVNSLHSVDELLKVDGFLVFVKPNCTKCDPVIYSVARAAKILGTAIQKVDCLSEEFIEFCKEKGINYSPSIWIVLDGHPTTGPCYTTTQCVDTFHSEKEENPSERKQRTIPKQETGRRAAQGDKPLLTDTKMKVDDLDERLAALERAMGLLAKRKEAAAEL